MTVYNVAHASFVYDRFTQSTNFKTDFNFRNILLRMAVASGYIAQNVLNR